MSSWVFCAIGESDPIQISDFGSPTFRFWLVVDTKCTTDIFRNRPSADTFFEKRLQSFRHERDQSASWYLWVAQRAEDLILTQLIKQVKIKVFPDLECRSGLQGHGAARSPTNTVKARHGHDQNVTRMPKSYELVHDAQQHQQHASFTL